MRVSFFCGQRLPKSIAEGMQILDGIIGGCTLISVEDISFAVFSFPVETVTLSIWRRTRCFRV